MDLTKSSSTQLIFENRIIYSAFQPIFSFSNQACIGTEALIRGHRPTSREALSVVDCLKPPANLCGKRYTHMVNENHLLNWQSLQIEDAWLFLNLDIQTMTHLEDVCLGRILEEKKVDGQKVVIEIIENEIPDEALFQKIIDTFRNYGCLIALDDFGAGHSNIDRIWKAQPDIVKLDRSILLEASKNVRSESILRNLTRLIKEAGSICLIEGIETQEQALLAMDVGADLVQGFYFARPCSTVENLPAGITAVTNTVNLYPAYVNEKKFMRQIQRKGYEALFEALDKLEALSEIDQYVATISELSFIKRFFILDNNGYQISEDQLNFKQKILKKGKGLCWKNRLYFIQAMQMEHVFVSNPYRSLIDMELCLTISKKITLSNQEFVACFDVYYRDKATEAIQISV